MKRRSASDSHDPARRRFFRMSALAGLGAAVLPPWMGRAEDEKPPEKPGTNIADALKYPRTERSMPGKYPGTVARVYHPGAVKEGKPVLEVADEMLRQAMLSLTGAASLEEAWRQFVGPEDIIGLKVNPVAGKLLSTSHEVTRAVIAQLEKAGIPRANLVIWDRREMQLHEVGYTTDNYPGIRITGTECQDEEGSLYNKEGKLYGEERIDKDWYYWADVEGEYDAYTLPYMVNGGQYSYFSRIVTKEVDKIINIPILKNAGGAVTLCLKNLAYGAITNTGRLHKQLWSETCAEVCAFPPLRDKVVLNIVDGLRGCYEGGPGANPQYIVDYNVLLAGSDPVAVDQVGQEIVTAKRLETGVQTEVLPRYRKFLVIAQELGLGVADPEKIQRRTINLG